MRTRIILVAMAGLLIIVFLSCTISEISWNQGSNTDSLRQLVGLPSNAVGNLNPAARNPGLEFLCPSLYDSPGGYCYYFAPGVPPINFTIYSNVTASGR